MKIACLFPGQGAQTVGMGGELYSELASARHVFSEIDRLDTLKGRSISQLCFYGPAQELKRTINTQPTILAVSLAAWAAYRESGGPDPCYVAGHSLGEFSALCAANVLSMADVLALVIERAKLMEGCAEGAMSAVLGMNAEKLEALCAEVASYLDTGAMRVAVVANFNTREQNVVSGDAISVGLIGERVKEHGAKVIPLTVGGAFHSPLMNGAASAFRDVIDKTEFNCASYPVIQNFSAQVSVEPSVLRENVASQMTGSVRWLETIELMLNQGVTHFVEVGPGKVLSGMVKKVSKHSVVLNVEDRQSLEKTLAVLQSDGKALFKCFTVV